MIRRYGGKELAKVLIYYGLIVDVDSSEFSVLCPFHDDVNPSMRVCLSDGSFFCFACESKGNALDFVKLANPELNDLQCCILLEQILNSKEVKALKIRYKKKKRINNKQALRESHDYYYGLRKTNWYKVSEKEEVEALEYMKNRGFDERALTIAKCKADCYNMAYPILFPILDNGEFRGWVARTTNKFVEKKRKYLYNDGFVKRNTLCGNYEKGKPVYVCEGFIDYLSLRTRGHKKNVVALLGWHISDMQVEKLKKKGVTRIVSVLDNDTYGIKGTKYLKNFFNDVVRFQYPEGKKDPGDMTEKEIREGIRRAKRI